jgi:hypothetical protein
MEETLLIAYWIVAGLLALLYVFSGGTKTVRSQEKLRPMMGWVDTMPMGFVRLIGIVEVLAAVGLIVPPLTGILPPLAFFAAIGLVAVQIAAIALHVARGESRQLGVNVVFLVLAGVAVWLGTIWL